MAKRRMTAQRALEWAFRSECAQLELPEREAPEARGFGFGMEYVLLQKARLGADIDCSSGGGVRSSHEDAEAIAAVVSNLHPDVGGRRMAVRLAECARAGITPDWMPGAVPRLEPREWAGERKGRSEFLRYDVETFQQPHPKNRARMMTRRRKVEVRYTPCVLRPDPRQIEAQRESYVAWWRALDEVRASLKMGRLLRTIELTDQMPPARPWLTRETLAV